MTGNNYGFIAICQIKNQGKRVAINSDNSSFALDKRPVNWLIRSMKKTVGIFEAKTKFSEICARVAETGAEYVVTKRGRELVRIVPASEKAGTRPGICDAVRKRLDGGGLLPDDGFLDDAWRTRTERFSSEESDE
jgi:prevent-host-death family protein